MASNTQPSELDDRALSFEEAERLAAQFKPSWELDDGAFGSAGLPAKEIDELSAGAPVALDGGGLSLSTAAAASISSDTIIDGIPTMSIGESSPSAEPPRRTEPAAPLDVAPPPPKPASRTQLGIGASETGPSSRKDAPPSSRNDAPPSSRKAKPSVPRATKSEPNGSRDPVSVRGGRASAPPRSVPSQPAEDAIDLPVSASKGMIFKVLGGVVAVGVVIVAIKLFSGSGDAPAPAPAPTPSVQATVVTPPAPSPTQTAAAAPPPPVPSPTQTAAAAPPPPPPAPPATPEPPPKKAAASTPSPPPAKQTPATPPATKKSGGGIIRDAPF